MDAVPAEDVGVATCLSDEVAVVAFCSEGRVLKDNLADEATAGEGEARKRFATERGTVVEVENGFVKTGVDTAGDVANMLLVALDCAVVHCALEVVVVGGVCPRMKAENEDLEAKE